MKAVYLRSVKSLNLCQAKRQTLVEDVLSDTDDEDRDYEAEDDGDEDSFVVDNDFVEYATQYCGDEMLAEDTIIGRELERCANKKLRKSKQGKSEADQKSRKRKRICVVDSSSDDEGNPQEKQKDEFTEGKISKKWNGDGKKCKNIKSIVINNNCVQNVIPKIYVPMARPQCEDTQKEGQIIPKIPVELKMTKKDLIITDISKHDEMSDALTAVSRRDAKLYTGNDAKKSLGVDLNSKDIARISTMDAGISRLETGTSNPNVNLLPMCNTGQESEMRIKVAPLILVDSCEIGGGGTIINSLRLRHGACTSVVQLCQADYAVSMRMAIIRIHLSVFVNNRERKNLIQKVKCAREAFERVAILVEKDRLKPGETPRVVGRSKYLDTIVAACIQVPQLRVFYSGDQEESADVIWQLTLAERLKGHHISVSMDALPRLESVVKLYRMLPFTNYAVAFHLAASYSSFEEFTTSSMEVMKERSHLPENRVRELFNFLRKPFNADMLTNA